MSTSTDHHRRSVDISSKAIILALVVILLLEISAYLLFFRTPIVTKPMKLGGPIVSAVPAEVVTSAP